MSDEIPGTEGIGPETEAHPAELVESIKDSSAPETEVESPVTEPIIPPTVEAASGMGSIPPMSPPTDPIPPMSAPPEVSSNYPRTGNQVLGYIRPPGIYWDSIQIAWTMVTSNVGVYVVCALICALVLVVAYVPMIALMFGSLAAASAAGGSGAANLFMVVPQTLIQVVVVFLQLCMISVGVRHAQGFVPQVYDLFIPFKKFKSAALATLVVSVPFFILNLINGVLQLAMKSVPLAAIALMVVVLLGSLVLYVGLYGPLVLSGVAAIFSDKSPIDTARTLYTRLRWQSLMLGLLFIVVSFISGLGVIACFIGLLFTYPVLTNTMALHYVYNFPEDQPNRQVG